jgi:type II secretory pathway pseudopilin PulG
LLVSLAVLGLIAGLTVPSIVISVEQSKNKTLLKETIGTLKTLTMSYSGFSSEYPSFIAYLKDKMAYQKYCPTTMVAGGCRTTVPLGFGSAPSSPGFLLQNGVTVTLFDYSNGGILVAIDVNGDKADSSGTNRIPALFLNSNETTIVPHSACASYNQPPQSIQPWCQTSDQVGIWNWIYN